MLGLRGRFKNATGKWHAAEACIDRADDLHEWRRISASMDIGSARRGAFRDLQPAKDDQRSSTSTISESIWIANA